MSGSWLIVFYCWSSRDPTRFPAWQLADDEDPRPDPAEAKQIRVKTEQPHFAETKQVRINTELPDPPAETKQARPETELPFPVASLQLSRSDSG